MARVALIGENSIEYIEKLIDIWNDGDCAVLIDWRTPMNVAIEMMQEANVEKCIVQSGIFAEINNKHILFNIFEKKQNETQCLPQYIYERFIENYSTNEAIIIYSSGTTGKSKGIILSHYAINTNADSIINYMDLSKKDCIYMAKTISHSSTITGELLVALKTNTRIIIGPIIVPPRVILKNIIEFKVSIICLNPTLLKLITENQLKNFHSLDTLKKIYVSGSILTKSLYMLSRKAFKNVDIFNVYGLSEAGPRVSAQTEKSCKNNSVGKSIKNVHIKIIKENGIEAEKNEKGLIHIKTPSLFKGYVSGKYKHESLWQNWFNTGDIGYFDNNSDLIVIGRFDDLIIINEHKIYPAEIEQCIMNSAKNIVECVVVGLEICLGCLYCGTDQLTEIQKKAIKNQLLPYEMPRVFLKAESMPTNINGKLDIRKAKELLEKYIGEKND